MKYPVIVALVLTLLPVHIVLGQETISVSFDGPPPSYGATSRLMGYYVESGVGVSGINGLFTRRWPGAPGYPENGTAYLQSGIMTGLGFRYLAGHRFTPVSVDLALYSTASLEPVTLQFVGRGYSGEIMATREFLVLGVPDSEGRPAFQTFYFGPDFDRIYYLSVANTPRWSLDNLVVSVPEPPAGSLFMLGTLGLWLLRRHSV